MKKKIIIGILTILVLLVLIITYKALVKKKIDMVLPNEITEINGDKEFSNPRWGPTSTVCRQGGFDILGYAGKEVTIESSLAIGKFYKGIPLNLYKIYAGDKMICAYYTDSTELLVPGIFSINDSDITGQ